MHYYKLSEEKSKEIIAVLEKVEDYADLVKNWITKNFEVKDDTSIYIFDDIPEVTTELIQLNPKLREIANKTNARLNNSKGKELIKDWKEFKKANGYKITESYDRGTYAMTLRSMFPKGSVSPLIDYDTNTVYMQTSEPYRNLGKNDTMVEITLKEFNLKEIELSENEQK